MKIITRSEWGARNFVRPRERVGIATRSYFVSHYPGAGTPPKDIVELCKWIERIHIDQNGWSGVGYNYVISHGKIAEGCGRDVIGSHSPPRNRDGVGVMIWTSNGVPLDEDLALARELYDKLSKEAGHKLKMSYHGEHYATACPGPAIREWVKDGMPVGDSKPDKPKPTPAPKPKPKPSGWDGKSFPGASAFKIGKSHPAVTVLGQRLVAHGFGRHYKVGPGPRFSEADRKNCQEFQLAQGYVGTAKGGGADGYPGPQTWAALMKAPKSKAKPKPKGKTVAQLAKEVIDGKWGNDPARSRKLKAAGYDPKAVQAEVNRRLR